RTLPSFNLLLPIQPYAAKLLGMSVVLSSSRRIFSKTPVELIHFSPFPGRFIRKAQRTSTDNYNSVVITNKLVDPDYRWQDDKWYHPNVQGASLWTPGIQLGRLIAAYYWESEWNYESEDPAMIWQIPAGKPPVLAPRRPSHLKAYCQPTLLSAIDECGQGTSIPEDLRLVEQSSSSSGSRGAFALQPSKPMPFHAIIALNASIRRFQLQGSHDSRYPFYPNGGRVVRLYDWLTADNPLAHRHPEILRGWNPDVSGNAYGGMYTWETAGVVWRLRKRRGDLSA
ncbi:MAG: hypothetical protein LQ346_003869, partial [Caloplaca aetnensis]